MKVLQEIVVPQETVNDETLAVVGLHFKTGDQVKAGDEIIDLETSKTVLYLDAEASGYIEYLCELNDDVPVGSVVVRITDEAPVISKPEKSSKTEASGDVVITPAALDLMDKHGVDQKVFSGRDIVSKNDVLVHLGMKPESKKASPSSQMSFQPEADIVVERKEISKSKRREIEYLTQVQSAGLNSTVYVNVDADGLFESVNKHLNIMKGSMLPLVSYELSRLLLIYKEFNAYYDSGSIAYYDAVNLGLAMDIDDGLKVLTLREASSKSMPQVEEEIFDLANKYVDKQLAVRDLTGSTFTITDLSAEGVSFFTPLINMGQSAILGISAIDKKLQRVTLSLTFDHRVTEGKRAIQLLRDLKVRLESYLLPQEERIKLKNKDIRCDKTLKSLEDLADTEIGMIKVIKKNGEEVYISDLSLLGF